ncbi:hypothetical protein [Metaclostridioides mangenotii]|uniref:hypothetical protein n=1 Tax=Metaclostridioides mangenotii TaxID=1540 RepID=UPI0028E898AB|nr:hypothetical protein [Clostridioides mangenotii]
MRKRKIILSVVLAMTLIVGVGCNSSSGGDGSTNSKIVKSDNNTIRKDLTRGVIFEAKLTPKNQVEVLSRSEYANKLTEAFKVMRNTELAKEDEFYKKAIVVLPQSDLSQMTPEQLTVGLLAMDKIILQEVSKITCENEDVAELHTKILNLLKEKTENRAEVAKIDIQYLSRDKIDSRKAINEIIERNDMSTDVFLVELKDLSFEMANKIGVNVIEGK